MAHFPSDPQIAVTDRFHVLVFPHPVPLGGAGGRHQPKILLGQALAPDAVVLQGIALQRNGSLFFERTEIHQILLFFRGQQDGRIGAEGGYVGVLSLRQERFPRMDIIQHNRCLHILRLAGGICWQRGADQLRSRDDVGVPRGERQHLFPVQGVDIRTALLTREQIPEAVLPVQAVMKAGILHGDHQFSQLVDKAVDLLLVIIIQFPNRPAHRPGASGPPAPIAPEGEA